MDLIAFILTFTLFWKLSSSVRCYRCDQERQAYNLNVPLCEHFDYSDKYIVDCEYSNTCFKTVTSLDYGNGLTTSSVQRGCAPQLMSGDQEKINGHWQSVKKIYDVYKEKCEEEPNEIERVTKTVHCYCKSDLCNSARKITRNYFSILVTAITLVAMS